MNPHAPLIDTDGEVRELTAADMHKFKPATEVLPLELQKTPTKVSTTIQLSPEVVA